MTQPSFIPIKSAEVRQHNGMPALFVNGSPQSGLTYMTYNPKAENFSKYDELGVRVMSFSVTSDSNFWSSWAAQVHRGPGDYYYSDFDERIKNVVEAAPNSWLLPRVYTVAPEWWCKQHEQEMALYGEPRERPRPDIDTCRKRIVPSMASKAWRELACDNMARLVRHVEEGPYADRFLGYHFASGIDEEWIHWGTDEGYFPDYSKPMLVAFREFLTERYGSDQALQEAWHRNDVTLDTATIPTIEERVREGGSDQFRDPQAEQNVADYLICHSYAVVDTMCALAKAVKEASAEPRMTLAFSGSYVCDQNWMQFLTQNGGTLALERLVQCPHLDALTSPSTYAHRGAGTGHSSFMTLQTSVALHGKLWFDEDDCRTHLPKESKPNFGSTHCVSDTICTQRRQFSAVMQQGCAMWWFDMGGNWYDEPVHEEARRSVEIARRALDTDRSSAAEIALIVDSKSIAYMGGSTSNLYAWLSCPKRNFGRSGAPYDLLTLDDLPIAKDYKLYAFLNAYHVTDEQHQMIERIVKCDGKTAWWFHAAGYVNQTRDVAHMIRLTGINLEVYGGHNRPDTEVRPGDHPIVAGLDRARFYGGDCSLVIPFVYAVDPDATPLGLWEYDEYLPLLAVKELDGWNSIYSMGSNPPSWLIRRVARWAGVHIYNEIDEAFYANQSLIAVSTNNETGPRTIGLPRRTSVYELFDENREWSDVTEFTLELPRRHTSMFFLGSKEQWDTAADPG